MYWMTFNGTSSRDNYKLINIMKSLRDLGNTVLVVEHDSDMMKGQMRLWIWDLCRRKGRRVIFQRL